MQELYGANAAMELQLKFFMCGQRPDMGPLDTPGGWVKMEKREA